MSRKHGLFVTHRRESRIWRGIVQRTTNPKNSRYPFYGGRGIQVCDRWRRSFLAFVEDMGAAPSPRHKIDRIDNNGHYEPGNCRWATQSQQMRNTRRNRLLTLGGVTKSLIDWSEAIGITVEGIYYRLKNGWTVEEALSEPKRQGRRRQPDEEGARILQA